MNVDNLIFKLKNMSSVYHIYDVEIETNSDCKFYRKRHPEFVVKESNGKIIINV